MSNALRLTRSRANLSLAWEWTHSNTERAYREYCGPQWRAASLAIETRLETLRDQLLSGTYEPEHATKLFLPKKSGIQRPYTLLTVSDQIVYQAFGNVIAEKLSSKVRGRYNKTVFGHLYAGRTSPFFYRNWKYSYKRFTDGMRAAYSQGYVYTASFDLTACYDSIDHAVLGHSLRELRLDDDFIAEFLGYLSHWTEYSGGRKRLYHGHGIPQGPLPSGLLAETVLRFFDDADGRKNLRYFRYVDDIRLFARDERSLRRELVALDVRSKQLGLFPQSSKIDIHRITNIADEFKSISLPQGHAGAPIPKTPKAITRELLSLSRRMDVRNPTRLMFLLALAPPSNGMAQRVIQLISRDPSLYESGFRYLSRVRHLTVKTARAAMSLLAQHDVYPAFAASLLRAFKENLPDSERASVHRYARSFLKGPRRTSDPELYAACIVLLSRDSKLSFASLTHAVTKSPYWWTRATCLRAGDEVAVGLPSYQSLVHAALKDPVADVALTAAELCVVKKLARPVPLSDVNEAGQEVLRKFGVIGRMGKRRCVVAPLVTAVLGSSFRFQDWRRFFDATTYRHVSTRFAVWRGYGSTDATAWIALTDTINDILLSRLYPHDGSIGGYQLGNIGGTTASSTSAFARKYPSLWKVCCRVHKLRLESDIAHPVTKSSGLPTRRIRFTEAMSVRPLLRAGWSELHDAW